jgi:hypothetical protein
MNSELQRFVRDALARGLGRPAIREALHEAGWRADEIDAALASYAESSFPVPVPRRRPYLSPREAFLYLVLFATLYTTAYDTGQVLFGLIAHWFPDPVARPYEWRNYAQWIRDATAGLIIAFPVYLTLSRVIGREIAREPEKRGSPVRKWLTYITLFVTAVVIIADLTVLVTRVLSGELPVSFLLRVVVVFMIAGAVFSHYLADLRREEVGEPRAVRLTGLLAITSTMLVFVTIVAGLIFIGSPGRERLRRLDLQRVEALRNISSAVEGYYAARSRLPDSLATLLRLPDRLDARALRDPVTGAPYRYQVIDSLAYELCARFATRDTIGNPDGPGSEFWKHEAGEKCFRFEVQSGGKLPARLGHGEPMPARTVPDPP